jgi:hypothetical protein
MKFFLLYYSIIFATSLTANTIWIHQNKNAQIPTNLKTRFEYWQSIYNNYIYTPHCDYYDFSKDPYHNKDKQDALKTLVAHQLCYDNKNNKFFSENNLNLLLTKALIVTNQDKEQTFTAIAQKVPCYNGTNENWRNLYSTEALSKFRELLYHNVTYDNNTETKFLQSSPIVFPASITPCWSWDKDSQQLVKKENIGIIFCNGVNFETQNTADYKTFNNNIDKLKEHINTIALCMITAAY